MNSTEPTVNGGALVRMGWAVWRPLWIVALIAIAASTACFQIAMDRYFDARQAFKSLPNHWRVGTPIAVAFKSYTVKSDWDSFHKYCIYIPIARERDNEVWKDFHRIRQGVQDNEFRIDSVVVTFFDDYRQVSYPIHHWDDSLDHAGEVALYSPQDLFPKHDYLCMFSETIPISPDEDSIEVSFVAEVFDSIAQSPVAIELEYRLRRHEGKKLKLDVGR